MIRLLLDHLRSLQLVAHSYPTPYRSIYCVIFIPYFDSHLLHLSYESSFQSSLYNSVWSSSSPVGIQRAGGGRGGFETTAVVSDCCC